MKYWIKEIWGGNPGLYRKRVYADIIDKKQTKKKKEKKMKNQKTRFDYPIYCSGQALIFMCVLLRKTPDQLPIRKLV